MHSWIVLYKMDGESRWWACQAPHTMEAKKLFEELHGANMYEILDVFSPEEFDNDNDDNEYAEEDAEYFRKAISSMV